MSGINMTDDTFDLKLIPENDPSPRFYCAQVTAPAGLRVRSTRVTTASNNIVYAIPHEDVVWVCANLQDVEGWAWVSISHQDVEGWAWNAFLDVQDASTC